MAVKTITIDLEAYQTLARLKREGQSFSQVIKERLGGRGTGADLLRAVRANPVSEETLRRISELVESRGEDPARAPEL